MLVGRGGGIMDRVVGALSTVSIRRQTARQIGMKDCLMNLLHKIPLQFSFLIILMSSNEVSMRWNMELYT
jgi:hypothetical protein